MKKRPSFTLIEMLVTVMIVGIIAAASTLSFGSAKSSESVAAQSDEFKSLLDELRSFAAGQDRDRAGNYILIIKPAGTIPVPYCGGSNTLVKNQYMICETDNKDISSVSLTSLSRVRAGSFDQGLKISSTGFDPANPTASIDPIVINIRVYDGQIGFSTKYCDLNPAYCGSPVVTLDLAGQKQILTLNSISGILR